MCWSLKILSFAKRTSRPGKKGKSGKMTSSLTDRKEISKFGLIAFLFFGMVCSVGIWRQKPIPIIFFGALSLIGLGLFLLPEQLRPIHSGWMNVAHFIGRLTTGIILTLAYYLVITPTALLKRIFGGRPLPIRPDKSVSSYWVSRSEPAQSIYRFKKRF